MNVWQAFGFVALGMALSHIYNWMAWKKYYEGRREYHEGRDNRNDSRATKVGR